MRALCAGHVNWDVTLRVEDLPAPDGEADITAQARAGGGSAANTAAALAGLGVETALLGSVGTDENGRLAVRDLEAAGVDCEHVRAVPGETTVKYLVVDEDGEVMVLANDGVNEAYSAADLESGALAGFDHLHLTGQTPETAATLARRASRAGLTVSLDPGRRLCDRDYREAAASADYLFLNERERDCATEAMLAAVDGPTVCKHGTGGGAVRGPEGCSHPGFDVDPLDTAGAGDAFAAGFLAAVFDGATRAEALAVANACGALASRELGARVSLSWADVAELRR